MEDEEYKESEISKKVKELMDDGYEFGEAVREALKQGFADGGSIGIEVLFKPKRQNLFMGGPALTGPALNIYNSMKAYQSFTDQEIADAIKEAGYDLPTADSGTTTPPDSTPNQESGGGEDRSGSMPASMGGIGYSPEQNVLDFQAYQDEKNKEAMGSPFTSGPMVDSLNDKIADQMRKQNPNLNKYTNLEIISMNPDMFNVGEVEDLSTFGKMKGSFNTGIRSLIDSPIGKVAGFALNPALGLAKGIIGAIPSATPVGRVGNRNIYGVGSFGGVQGSINRENQTALNKTGNFTNFQLGLSGDPGRVAGDPTTNVFAGMNAQSALGDISKGAKSRIDTISKTLERQKKAGKTPSKVLTERKAKFEKQLLDHNTERARSREDKSGATGTKKGGFTNPGKNSYGPHKGGGGGGGGGGCFLKGTLITMLDGTRKPVEQVDLGNKVAIGGKVFATGKFLVENLHDYKGIKVSGSHMVNEDNKWVRVEDSKHGKPLGDDEHTVYVFGSENRRILINGILFTDYFETKEQEKLIDDEKDFFDNWKSYDKKIDLDNINTLNAN
jgi:hypothetical protein